MYKGRGGWAMKRCNDSEKGESTEEQLQCKKQHICTPPPGTLFLASLLPLPCLCTESMHQIHVLNPCMKPLKRVLRICDIEITNPHSYCGKGWSLRDKYAKPGLRRRSDRMERHFFSLSSLTSQSSDGYFARRLHKAFRDARLKED